jgi:hypothetical protein
MRALAEYVMRGRKQAILLALLFTFVPFMGWIADAIMALVTLRKGAKEGLIILMWELLPTVVVAVLMGRSQLWPYVGMVIGSILVYLFALILRQTNAWAVVVQASMILGIVAVLLVHASVPNIAQIVLKDITAYLQMADQQASLNWTTASLKANIGWFVQIATGLQIALLLLGDLISLAIARWWQGILYNPGALKPAFYNIRFGWVAALILIGIVIAALFGDAAAIDALPVVLFSFVWPALSLIHNMAARHNVATHWLVFFYVLCVILLPYMLVLLTLVAMVDSWRNFRHRLTT